METNEYGLKVIILLILGSKCLNLVCFNTVNLPAQLIDYEKSRKRHPDSFKSKNVVSTTTNLEKFQK